MLSVGRNSLAGYSPPRIMAGKTRNWEVYRSRYAQPGDDAADSEYRIIKMAEAITILKNADLGITDLILVSCSRDSTNEKLV